MSQETKVVDSPMPDLINTGNETKNNGKLDDYLIPYETKSGEIFYFDTSPEACGPYGFYSGSRVETPKGDAIVVGVYDGFIWFHIDSDRGASYWDNAKTYEDLLRLGITLVSMPEIEVEKQGDYRIKRVETVDGKPISIVLQNENGPCPLIAICNILAIQQNISLETKNGTVSVEAIVGKIGEHIRKLHPSPSPETATQIEQVIQEMPELQVGLDVNFTFMSCDNFEKTRKTKIFELLGIPMVHGWLVDPNERAASVIANYTYNDLTLQLVTLRDKVDQKPADTNNTTKTSEEPKKEEEKKDERILTEEEGIILEEFLNSTSHQLTNYGLLKLHETLKENELVVFFRNNHFSTLTKHDGKLYNLVTDIGYERERNVVWDLLSSVDGNSCFYSSQFTNTDDVKKEEIINTALAYGFPRDKIDEAITAVTKPNEEMKVDEVLSWLSSNVAV